MKAGILEADRVLTVSPYYAEELISGIARGCELDNIMRLTGITGIVNGMDVSEWDPSRDKYIAVKYDVSTAVEAKALNKEALQAEVGLPGPPQRRLQRRGAGGRQEGGHHLAARHQGGRHAGVRGDGEELHDPGSLLEGPCQELGERAAQPRGRRRRARGRRRGDRAARQGERGRALKSSACRPPDLARGANMLGHLLIYAVSFM
ncbi:Granule-bound starch synthase 1 chloroplastic/amyloplastic [Zea mays]|uniref:Granule-bound starch synthase 1 chloroplastic/amyloplastic n=1 Tax=Zea mays TaxID=4577 RepID=A0A1D6L3I2_MAIZE|nr:Granule-bound starch synthase 1, chloroplastic/amyloplastic [Zea mays]ONM08991.1 Granule-bound starch synthase 1 chloroplastic/amyloplastic [Zea mays]